jgi:hypothetical protein
MTIDKLAVTVEQEFQNIREEFKGVHEEFGAIHNEIATFKAEVLSAIEKIDLHLSAYASRSSDDIAKLQESVAEHDGRLQVLEKRG